MALRISHLLVALCLLLVSCFALSDAANGIHARASAKKQAVASFDEKLQNLRKLAAVEQGATRDLIESLDELDDIELTQLRIPKRALAQDDSGPGVYGGRRQVLQAGTYPGVKRRSLLQGVYP